MLKPLLLSLILAAACDAPPSQRTASHAAAAYVQAAPAVLHTLTPADGVAVRGALTPLGDRLYGLAGEAGPLADAGCYSSSAWGTATHQFRCPGTVFSLRQDGTDFRVDHGFTPLIDGVNLDGYHPYGTLAAGSACSCRR